MEWADGTNRAFMGIDRLVISMDIWEGHDKGLVGLLSAYNTALYMARLVMDVCCIW
jgi:hypothetical protein